MYKNIISKIVDKKVEENNQAKLQQAHQKRLENAKYNSSRLLVGYVSKIVVGRDNCLVKLMSNNLRMFVRINDNILQDIETGKKYPLILIKQSPKQNEVCVMERDLEPFTSICIEALDEQNIEYESVLTQNQAKDILTRQTRLNCLRF